MVEINLVGAKNNNTNKFVFKDDSAFETTGIDVDDVAYDQGSFLDRDYDVRGHDGVSVLLQNIGANSVDYKILGATKDFVFNALDSGLNDGDFTEELVAEAAIAAGVASSGTITCATVLAADTVTVNGRVYTAVAGVKPDNTKFSIDGGNNACATDLADSIANDVRVGTESLAITAIAATNVVTVSAVLKGPQGNTIAMTSSGATLTLSGATLAGGVDGASAPYNLVRTTPSITAIRVRAKETAGGSAGKLRGDIRAF